MGNRAVRSCRNRCAGSGAIMKSELGFMRKIASLFALLGCIVSVGAQNLAGDMALSLVLIDGQDWEEVAAGYQFTDAPCADADGNFYFTDVARGTNIFRVGADGK